MNNATFIEARRGAGRFYLFYQSNITNRCQISECNESYAYDIISTQVLLGGNQCKKISVSDTYFSVEFETEIWVYDINIRSGLVVIETIPIKQTIVDMKIDNEYLFFSTTT